MMTYSLKGLFDQGSLRFSILPSVCNVDRLPERKWTVENTFSLKDVIFMKTKDREISLSLVLNSTCLPREV